MLTLGTVVAMVAGIVTGVLAAWRRGRAADYGHTGVACCSTPSPPSGSA
jgi:ABC-type dipeptide/oligopeptide/nickel transport system permease component